MKAIRLLAYVLLLVLFGSVTSAQGVTITVSCGAVGKGYDFCKSGAEAWAAKTGNSVKVLPSPKSTTDRLALYQQQLAAGSSDVDVYMIDVIWPGILADFFIDLREYVSPDLVKEFFPRIVAANTVDGRLVGLPWFTDAGLLYYRTDLLAKYGYSAPPTTWEELEQMAAKIQAGERKAGNGSFWGFVFQGKAYEGLTCDALEWIFSYRGGTIVDKDGNITVNNPNAAKAIDTAARWVGTIAPPGVTSYQEEEARGVWQAGNAAFMRNWPYAYSLGNSADSPIKGKFDVTVLPKGGPNGQHAATLGGWQLAVSRFSKHPKEAVDLIVYLTGYDEQKRRAIEGSYLPTRPALYKDNDVLTAMPFMGRLYDVFVNAVPRPSAQTKQKYNQVSSAFWTAVHNVLVGQIDAATSLRMLEQQLKRIKGKGW
ncbi:extracellular solute-binding protein family 1 [Oceanithermus profundus DSM 14977]|uniref:Extracellular solute-binding protein family 1 n=1 Tax=Oceanithermus profundus (strain DSM 14977 / NBRC 100410 / VKM B-2274 / 506) TaxID=670487 RepID=E4U691_OCEP5|nr:ABC transporter substrate-binding protein [Oceanithermus profundus]ADR35964.1 extracellular solute-binding protein family 1 [Oceanithermus profundus DSM 14977]